MTSPHPHTSRKVSPSPKGPFRQSPGSPLQERGSRASRPPPDSVLALPYPPVRRGFPSPDGRPPVTNGGLLGTGPAVNHKLFLDEPHLHSRCCVLPPPRGGPG